MKKITINIIIVIALLNTIGFLPAYLLLKHSYKKEMLQYISNIKSVSGFEIIKFYKSKNLKDVKDIKLIDEKEFWYKGKLYDIIKQETNGESLIIYCINDSKEENLFAQLSDQINSSVDLQNIIKHQKSKALKLFGFFSYFQKHETHLLTTQKPLLIQGTISKSVSYVFDIDTPPPRV